MTEDGPDTIRSRLGIGAAAPSGRRYLLGFALAAASVALIATVLLGGGDTGPRYLTQPVTTGDLKVVVSATGTLQPTNQVQVGIEVSGTIKTVSVNYNDRVTVGQVLAQIDTTKLEAQMRQTASALDAARARVQLAEATIRETRSKLARLREVRQLSGGKVPSPQEMDVAEADLARAVADAASARAAATQSEAILRGNQTDLAKATVRSTIDGVVLARSVEPGQTLAASFQTPVLFTLAEDLTRMELQVDIDEADVGQVRAGQRATFTVAAYPERVFPAEVIQVRFGAQTVAGVVTYKALLRVDNTEQLLLPGMTATASIAVKEVRDALLVPNAALRFSPPVVASASNASPSLVGRLFGGRRYRPAATAPRAAAGQRVYVIREDKPVAVPIAAGASDGLSTEIRQDRDAAAPTPAADGIRLEPGTPVVVDVVAPKS